MIAYNKIISATGLTGLFELISSKNDGAIVKSLEDGSTRFVTNRAHQFSHLESIEIYTLRDNVNLVSVFEAIEKSSEPIPDAKDAKLLRGYFEKVFPEMDFDRVYASDMKKMVKWYAILKSAGVEMKLSQEEVDENENTEGEALDVAADTEAAKGK